MPDRVRRPDPETQLSDAEMKVLTKVAQMHGITVEQAASALVKAGLARRVRKKTGHAPARVYPIGRKP